MSYSEDLKSVCLANTLLKEVHINQDGAWLFGDVTSVPKDFGDFDTIKVETILSDSISEDPLDETKKSKKTK